MFMTLMGKSPSLEKAEVIKIKEYIQYHFKKFFQIFYVCVCTEWGHVYTYVGAHGSQKRTMDALRLKLQVL